jgi:pimeloyl-ACP methyl ester carboxylesterase
MARLRLVLLACWALVTSLGAAEPAGRPVIVLVHGAWGGAWQFARIEPQLRERGFEVRRVTLTGLGERRHLATPEIGLATHVEDVANVLRFERLERVVLVGHSYGGMVVTGVADLLPERIARLIYLDAALPEDGESLADLRGGEATFAPLVRDGMVVPNWVPAGKPLPVDVPQPLRTFTDRLALKNPARAAVPGAYLLTVEPGRAPESDDFAPMAARARARGWPVRVMEADHNPHWRKPAETAALLAELAAPAEAR